jgi:hypothetical protein
MKDLERCRHGVPYTHACSVCEPNSAPKPPESDAPSRLEQLEAIVRKLSKMEIQESCDHGFDDLILQSRELQP